MGLPADASIATLTLTEDFPLVAPTFDLNSLLQTAHEASPVIRAADAQREAASIGVSIAKSQYLPSLGISTGLSGFTQQYTSTDPLLAGALASAQNAQTNCAFQNAILQRLTSPHPAPGGGIIPDCNAYAGLDATGTALQESEVQAIRDANTGFPFSFTRQPWSISLGISLPIWDGFSRAARVSSARATEEDAREAVRARRLDVDGQIQSGLLAVQTSYQAATIQGINRTAAAQQLLLAQERYRIGNGTALELADAQNAVTQAEVEYVTAVYDYHLAVAALEGAVGRPLR
jgi:outer membrane protein